VMPSNFYKREFRKTFNQRRIHPISK